MCYNSSTYRKTEKYKTEEIRMTKVISVSKRMLSLFMALLMLCSGMAVAYAAESVNVPTPVLTLDVKAKTITVKAEAPLVIEGASYPVVFSISPTAAKALEEDGDTLFYNLTMGTKYTVTATVTVDGKAYTSSASETLKQSQAAPSVQAAKTVTSTTIEIANITGCEYKIETEANEGEGVWGSATKFESLAPDTLYTISVRFKETNDKYASDATKLSVRTLKAPNTEKPDAPVLVDKTMTTITVKEVSKVIFSIDKINWQSSGEFKNLKSGVTYTVYAMYDYDSSEQEPGAISAPLNVTTNTKPNTPASLNDCKITLNLKDVNYSNESISFEVEVKSTYTTYKAEYGDTIYIPVSYQIDDGDPVKITAVKGNKFTAKFTPGADKSNKTIKLTINFAKIKFVGGKQWLNVGEEVSSVHKIDVGPEYTIFTRIAEAFTTVFNLLFDTLPGMLNEFLNGEQVADFFNFFLGLADFDIVGTLGGLLGGATAK